MLGGHTVNCELNPDRANIRAKMAKTSTGKVLSEETKTKLSIAMKKHLDTTSRIPYLENHSSKESYPESVFRELLLKNNIVGWTQEYRVLRYNLDFAFITQKIDIEIDGATHNQPKVVAIDNERNNNLIELRWKVLRIPAKLLIKDKARIYKVVVDYLANPVDGLTKIV